MQTSFASITNMADFYKNQQVSRVGERLAQIGLFVPKYKNNNGGK